MFSVRLVGTGLCAMLLMGGAAIAQEMDEKQKASYSVGIQLGKMVANTPELIDEAAMIQGIKDAMAGADPQIPEAEMMALLQKLQGQMQEAARKQAEEQGVKAKAEGEAYLEANKAKQGWETTPTGLQYKVITPGTGKTPTNADSVTTHYRGTFIDGTEFDSSYKRGQPATFGVTQVIPGWTEALLKMKEGAKWELVIPYALAYGEAGRAGIPPYSVLKFEIELIEIAE